jgi:glycosyltransferase involved in cell wall biosynthesis
MSARPVLVTGDIFRLQPRGGITRYFVEVVPRLPRETFVLAGLHVSAELDALHGRLRDALRVPHAGVVRRVAAPINAALEGAELARTPHAIVHPSYYRDPRTLPRDRPIVVTVHDMAHERLSALFPARRRWWSRRDPVVHKAALCVRADRVVCNSHATRADVLELLGLPAAKVRAVPHAGRDWSAVAPAPIAGIDRPWLLWVGERGGYKNFAATAAAWARTPECADTLLLAIGGGPLTDAEREALAALGVADRVRQRDATDGELRWAYEGAEALLYTTLWEGFGLPVLEALALGCPVLTSDRPALREVGGDAPCYVDPESPDALRAGIAAVRRTGRDAARRATGLAQAARFSWDACAAGLETVYRELD